MMDERLAICPVCAAAIGGACSGPELEWRMTREGEECEAYDHHDYTPSEAWDVFVGHQTPADFMAAAETEDPTAAIAAYCDHHAELHLSANWEPSWTSAQVRDALTVYLTESLQACAELA